MNNGVAKTATATMTNTSGTEAKVLTVKLLRNVEEESELN